MKGWMEVVGDSLNFQPLDCKKEVVTALKCELVLAKTYTLCHLLHLSEWKRCKVLLEEVETIVTKRLLELNSKKNDSYHRLLIKKYNYLSKSLDGSDVYNMHNKQHTRQLKKTHWTLLLRLLWKWKSHHRILSPFCYLLIEWNLFFVLGCALFSWQHIKLY